MRIFFGDFMYAKARVSVLLITFIMLLVCQTRSQNSLSDIEESVLVDSLYVLLDIKSSKLSEAIQAYADLDYVENETVREMRLAYFNAQKRAMQVDDPEGQKSLNRVLRNLTKNKDQLRGEEWDKMTLFLHNSIAKIFHEKGVRDSAASIYYDLVDVIDTMNLNYTDSSFYKYHINNFFNIANLFLFDNDEISTRYADSSIIWAQKLGEHKYLYSSFNIKYYSKYYEGTPNELNAIADSCIKYAVTIRQKGESAMHKCNALVEVGSNDQAMLYCNQAIQEYLQLNDSSFLSSTLHNMGNVFIKAEAPKRALAYFRKGYEYIPSGDHTRKFSSLEAISNLLFELGNYEESATTYNRYLKEFTTFYQDQLDSQFTEAEEKYQSAKKAIEIEKQKSVILRQNRNRNFIIGGAFGLLLLLGVIFYSLFERSKLRKNKVELELQLEKERAHDLQQLGETKTELFNNVSHELRTPLTLVIAPLEEALTKVKNIVVKENLERALSNSKRLLGLTNEILDISKIREAKIEMKSQLLELNSFLKRTVQGFDSLAGTREIKLQHNIKDEQFTILTDASKLEKIINNLLSNAIKFTTFGSEVVFHLDHKLLEQQQLLIKVIDKGKGISPGERERIFDRFYRSDNSRNTYGTGIGLSLVKELVTLMGGQIKLQSEVGKGSTFSLLLPFEHTEETVVQDTLSEAFEEIYPIRINGDKPKILIVEDDLEMSDFLYSLLSKDYQCTRAYNGREALSKLEREQFDLISSDVMMPEMNGFELRERLNDLKLAEYIPFIMLSARILEEDKLRGFKLGIDDYITKPFSPLEYKARVRNLIYNKIKRLEIRDEVSKSNTIEESLVERAKAIVLEHLDDTTFKVNDLATHFNYSSRQFSRILQKETGLSPVGFILEVRLQKAYHLIKYEGFSTINEVRYEIGIESASYFSKSFKQRFGVSPTSLIK